RFCEDHTEVVSRVDIDVVVIATPNDTHARVLLDFLATDKHILVEKPLCTTLEDCHQIVELARQRSSLLTVGMTYRFFPALRQVLVEINRGSIGEVFLASALEHRRPFRRKVDNWNRFNVRTGGTLVEKCCHAFDYLNCLVADKPTRVFAVG